MCIRDRTIALLIYVLIYRLWPSPSYEELTQISGYPAAFVSAVVRNLTLKGAIQNVLPFVFLLTMAVLACMEHFRLKCESFFNYSDILVLLGIFLICHLLSPVQYNAGRITMLVYPLYLPMAVLSLHRLVASHPAILNSRKSQLKVNSDLPDS